MRVIDADDIKALYPGRKSLNQVLNNAKAVSIAEQIENIKEEMCDNYCKMPYRYSANEWEEVFCSADSPCNNCPLNKL